MKLEEALTRVDDIRSAVESVREDLDTHPYVQASVEDDIKALDAIVEAAKATLEKPSNVINMPTGRTTEYWVGSDNPFEDDTEPTPS